MNIDEVHVWCVPLVAPQVCVDSLRAVLSAEEIEHAARFAFERQRTEYILSRGCLRQVIAHYLEMDARAVEFMTGQAGKPGLAASMPRCDLRFNISHSGGLAVFAFASRREIGVDIERIREMEDRLDLARRFFSPGEYSDLLTLTEQEQLEAFFRCWSRKEAFIKAIGQGMSFPLDSFRMSLLPEQPPLLLALAGVANPQECWSVHELCPCPGYVGAVVAEGSIRAVLSHDFRDSEQCLRYFK